MVPAVVPAGATVSAEANVVPASTIPASAIPGSFSAHGAHMAYTSVF